MGFQEMQGLNGLKGSVRVPGTMVGTRYGESVHWSSKAVSVVLETVVGRVITLHLLPHRKKNELRCDVMIGSGSVLKKSEGFENDRLWKTAEARLRVCFRT